jgi:hypothetical protein
MGISEDRWWNLWRESKRRVQPKRDITSHDAVAVLVAQTSAPPNSFEVLEFQFINTTMAFQPPFSDPPINQRQNGPPPNTRGACWPDLGVQMDLNALWEYVNSLSQLHEGIRAQTQSVLHGVQTVQARGLDGSSAGTSPVDGARTNGALNCKSWFSLFLSFKPFLSMFW